MTRFGFEEAKVKHYLRAQKVPGSPQSWAVCPLWQEVHPCKHPSWAGSGHARRTEPGTRSSCLFGAHVSSLLPKDQALNHGCSSDAAPEASGGG